MHGTFVLQPSSCQLANAEITNTATESVRCSDVGFPVKICKNTDTNTELLTAHSYTVQAELISFDPSVSTLCSFM